MCNIFAARLPEGDRRTCCREVKCEHAYYRIHMKRSRGGRALEPSGGSATIAGSVWVVQVNALPQDVCVIGPLQFRGVFVLLLRLSRQALAPVPTSASA
jgi:hypothetical protein